MKVSLPILDWMKSYDKNAFGGDLSAGITVGIMLIPQGMAYAMLAGLPPIYGLYASTIPLFIYAILGTSRQLAVGPVAMVSLMVASGVGMIADIGSDDFIAMSITLALMVGIIQVLLGLFRLGFLVNLLSHPVIAGFTSAAALIIGFSQLKHLLGIDIPRGKVHETIMNVGQNIADINLPTILLGIGTIITIVSLRKINKKIPSPLIVVLLGVGLVSFFGLNEMGVKIIKEVPSGFPAFSLPSFSYESIIALLPIALAISFISYMESYAVAKAIQARHKDYQIDPNQELIALGAANIGGSFFSAFPTTGGFSRTAVNDQAGAKTGVAAMISGAVVLITILFFTQYFYYLPKAVLAAIIMVAVFGLIDFKEAKHLWKTDRLDFAAFMITALATLILGVEPGIALGVVFSLLLVLYRLTYPHIAEIGRIPQTNTFRNVSRYNNVETTDNRLMLRVDSQLFFGNTETFKSYIWNKINERNSINTVLLDASGINSIDSTAVLMMIELQEELKEKNIVLQIAEIRGPVRDKFHKSHVFEKFGYENIFLSIEDAWNQSTDKTTIQDKEFSKLGIQYNIT